MKIGLLGTGFGVAHAAIYHRHPAVDEVIVFGRTPAKLEQIAAQIARLHGKTRSWVYDHAGELGAVRLGSGPRPRLGFSPARVAERLEKVDNPASTPLPECPRRRHRRQRASRTAMGAPLLHVRSAGT